MSVAGRNRRAGFAPHQLAAPRGCEPGAGAFDGDGVVVERFARSEVAGGDKALACDCRRVGFARRGLLASVPERSFDIANAAHHRGKRRRFERGGVIGAGQRAVEREVLFDDARAECDGGERDLAAERVIGESDRKFECGAHGFHRAQIHIRGRGGIAAHAMQQRERSVAFPCDRGDGGLHFGERGHAGGENDRAALAGEMREERQVRDFAGGNLEGAQIERFEQVGTGFVERRGEKDQSPRGGVRHQFAVRGFAEFEPLEHRKLRLFRAGRLLLVVGFRRVGGDELLGLEGLKFHRIRARIRGGVDEPAREVETAVVIHPGLRDHETRVARTDDAAGYFNRCHGGAKGRRRANPTRSRCRANARAA